MKRPVLSLFFVLTSLAAYAADAPKPLFIRARCDGKLSSVVFSSLKEAASASQKYQLVSTLDDNGHLDTVQTIYMTCAENNDVTAVATQFGIAKCRSTTVCHSAIDGISLNVALCNANLSADCGPCSFQGIRRLYQSPEPDALKRGLTLK
jgi:hypothetical protein